MKQFFLPLAALFFSTQVAAIDCGKISHLPENMRDYWGSPSIETFSQLSDSDAKRALAILGARRIEEVSPQRYESLTGKKLQLKHGYIILSARYSDYDGKYVLHHHNSNLFAYYGAMGEPNECERSALIVELDWRVQDVYYGVGAAK